MSCIGAKIFEASTCIFNIFPKKKKENILNMNQKKTCDDSIILIQL